jgi:flagellum-specific ATP synthase
MSAPLGNAVETIRRLRTRRVSGRVASVRGMSVLVEDLPLPVGSLVRFEVAAGGAAPCGEVVGFDGQRSVVMLLGRGEGLAPGTVARGDDLAAELPVGESLLGRVIDGMGRPIDGGSPPRGLAPRSLFPSPTAPLRRRRVQEPMPTGVRAIDGLLTLGKGQRVGVLSGPGVGKSTILASIARHSSADVNVVALVGERGREVRQFIECTLGPEGLARSVVVVATGDESPLVRIRAALAATTVAEHFRDQGADVVLLMDSITRVAQAQRQVGLTVGEHPATKGYTPSVFAMLPALMERAGPLEGGGSITGLYAVLVEGDDLTEPIADATRGVLDGHIALSRRLASRGHYPAIDVLESVSRVADDVCDEAHVAARRLILRLLAVYAHAEELIEIGAYAAGSNPECDVAIAMRPALEEFLRQDAHAAGEYPRTCRRLLELAAAARQHEAQRAARRR